MPQDSDEGRSLLQPEPVRECAQGVNGASSSSHFGAHHLDVMTERSASLAEAVSNSVE
jgi:hypothetical protein